MWPASALDPKNPNESKPKTPAAVLIHIRTYSMYGDEPIADDDGDAKKSEIPHLFFRGCVFHGSFRYPRHKRRALYSGFIMHVDVMLHTRRLVIHRCKPPIDDHPWIGDRSAPNKVFIPAFQREPPALRLRFAAPLCALRTKIPWVGVIFMLP